MDFPETANILIIDDDPGVVQTLLMFFRRMEMEAGYANTIRDGMDIINRHQPDLVLLDVNLPDGSGIDCINRIMKKEHPPQVIIMTAYSDPDGAQLAIESGAWDYLQKPISQKELKLHVIRSLQFQNQKKQQRRHIRFDAPDIIGESEIIRESLSQASQIAGSDANVLITGDTGTGKELFAKAIHRNSARRNGDFIVVDCSVLSDRLIESVLFGHEKGAFTGAEKKRNGLIALANGGTLFLDEIGELPIGIQSSFLRVLQEKKFRPVGKDKEVHSDFRVICATNRNLEQMEKDCNFRPDLLYRLNSFVLNLPPLKERNGDIALIAEKMIRKCCDRYQIPGKEMADDFVENLQKYDWPGNVRELVNTVETCVAAAQFENRLHAFHLPQKIRAKIVKQTLREDQAPHDLSAAPQPAAVKPMKYRQWLDTAEKKYFQSLYQAADGNIPALIELSGISRAALYRKLNKYRLK